MPLRPVLTEPTQALVKAAPTTIYTVPADATSTTLRTIIAVNTSASAKALTLWLVKGGGTQSAKQLVASALSIPANGQYIDDSIHTLPPGSKVMAQCAFDDDFSVTVDGAERTA
jgi:hypothetical protein